MLEVTAEDTQSQTKNVFSTQSAKGKLTEEEIHKMIEDAEKYKEEDEKIKRAIKAKNDLEEYCFNVLMVLNQIDIDSTERHVVESNCNDVQDWIKDENLVAEDIYKKKDELHKICSVLINHHM